MVKTIKLSDEEYQKIVEARRQLVRKGLAKVDSIIPEQEIDLSSFTLGAIAALGALTLIHLLSEASSLQIFRSNQISCESKLRFRRSDQDLDIFFYLHNLSEDDVVLDRIVYHIELTAQDGSVIETITGGYLKRMILRRGQQFGRLKKLRPSVGTLQKLSQMASKNEDDIKWELLGEAFFDSRKGLLEVALNEHDRSVHII